MFINVHAIQNFAYSNLNRDDAGVPKTFTFGGHKRARISSQCWKKAIRDASIIKQSYRSQKFLNKLVELALKSSPDLSEEIIIKRAQDILNKSGLKTNKDNQIEALTMIPISVINKFAEMIKNGTSDEKEIVKLMTGDISPDIALFGRMVASVPKYGMEGACQFLHPFSTHQINIETDFFTAVDDLSDKQENAGAGMLGDPNYDSPCYYRYMNINIDLFIRNMKISVLGLLKNEITDFVKQFILTIPSGKQNSAATKELPSFVLIELSDDAVSYANAFVVPIRPNDGRGIIVASVERLILERNAIIQMYNRKVSSFSINRTEIVEGHEIKDIDSLIASSLNDIP